VLGRVRASNGKANHVPHNRIAMNPATSVA
jgi:hypothetical protein